MKITKQSPAKPSQSKKYAEIWDALSKLEYGEWIKIDGLTTEQQKNISVNAYQRRHTNDYHCRISIQDGSIFIQKLPKDATPPPKGKTATVKK